MISNSINEDLIYYYKKYNIYEYFDDDMIKYMNFHVFKKGELICTQGLALDNFYFFVDGRAKVYITTPNGKSLLLRIYNPLQTIGYIELINEVATNCNIQAIEDCICLSIPFRILKMTYTNDKKFLNKVCSTLCNQLSSVSFSSSINMLYPLENRLASYLLAFFPSEISNTENIKKDNLTQISELLGSDYRHFLRVVNKLCDKGLIKRENRSLIIVNRRELEKIAVNLYS